MVFKVISLTLLIHLIFLTQSYSQNSSLDSLKSQILNIELRVENIELNLEKSQKKFQTGILIATLGYATTITGGLMLGRENDELGQTLLVAGGATGIVGTYKMVDAFRYLTGRKKKNLFKK